MSGSTSNISNISSKDRRWTDIMRESCILTEKNTKNIWYRGLQEILSNLRETDIRYLHPTDYFKKFIPLRYLPFQDWKEKPHAYETNGSLSVPITESIFFTMMQYSQVFLQSNKTFPNNLFGYLWLALASAVHPNELFDKQFRVVCENTILNILHKESPQLYESGLEYEALSSILSSLLFNSMNHKLTETQIQKVCSFLKIFLQCIQKKPFVWMKFIRTKENLQRLDYLLKSCLHIMLKHDIAKISTTIRKHVEEKSIPLSLEHAQSLIKEEKSIATESLVELFQFLYNIYKDFCESPIVVPSTYDFIVASINDSKLSSWKPIPNRYTMCLTPDSLSKDESRIIFLTNFYGLHPSFWFICSKIDLEKLSPFALDIEMKMAQYQKKDLKLLYTTSDFTPTKLNKPSRLEAIRNFIYKEKPNVPKLEEMAQYPWFQYEAELFQDVAQKLPHVTFSNFTSTSASPSSGLNTLNTSTTDNEKMQ